VTIQGEDQQSATLDPQIISFKIKMYLAQLMLYEAIE